MKQVLAFTSGARKGDLAFCAPRPSATIQTSKLEEGLPSSKAKWGSPNRHTSAYRGIPKMARQSYSQVPIHGQCPKPTQFAKASGRQPQAPGPKGELPRKGLLSFWVAGAS